ncbi:hypothetical protein LCGC14_2414860 [marine sediment metagenome]|uniref:Uncharacterized protein n=1 Tax=marine sediment metagenome TaxID=412755 RepID=A0A0F9BRF6_9ZZZZ
MDDDTVQTDSPSAGEESKETTPEKVVEPTMAETIQASVAEAMQGMESRLKQSARDTARFEVTKTRPEEGVNAEIKQALKGWDGSDGRTIEQVLDEADNKAQLKTYQDRDVETKRQQEQIDQGKLLYDNFLRSMKIDPADPEIDWARDESDVPKAIDRFNTSVAKKIAARDKPVEKAKTDDTDFVDTAVSAGVEGDAGFVERMVSGELEMSKDNVARFDKIRSK